MMRVVMDANVLMSALLFGGKPSLIVDMAKEGRVELFVSPFIRQPHPGMCR
ncbi:MAG: PIN domain-containing protein [Armatimonadetes bacterium]|nr:PIN domain-containing protein [Armatimonadota bacterium]